MGTKASGSSEILSRFPKRDSRAENAIRFVGNALDWMIAAQWLERRRINPIFDGTISKTAAMIAMQELNRKHRCEAYFFVLPFREDQCRPFDPCSKLLLPRSRGSQIPADGRA
jgi:hypothetical protein